MRDSCASAAFSRASQLEEGASPRSGAPTGSWRPIPTMRRSRSCSTITDSPHPVFQAYDGLRALWWLSHHGGLARGHPSGRGVGLPLRASNSSRRVRARRQGLSTRDRRRITSASMDGGQAQELEEARIILQARREIYGDSDPGTLDAMLQLGRTLRDAGELREAEHVLTTLLSMQNRAGEDDGARITRTEFNLAIVLDRLNEYDAARRLWERVLRASDLENGPDSELSLRTAVNLAITLRKLRRYGDEFPLRVRILDSTRRTLGSSPSSTPSGPSSIWPRRIATSAITKWRWSCSPRHSPAWRATEPTSERFCIRSGPSRRSS